MKFYFRYGGMNALDNAVLGLAGRLTEQSQIDKVILLSSLNQCSAISYTVTDSYINLSYFQLKDVLEDKIFDNIKLAATETTKQNSDWAKTYGSSIETILKQKNSAFRSLINHFVMYLSLAFITIYYKRN